jgi:hypothetical protein
MKVRVTFTEELLGTSSNNPEIQREFIASKAPNAISTEEEIEALGVDEIVEKGMSVFPRENGVPFLWNYQWKGYFKDACSMLSRCPDTKSKSIKAFKKIIDGLVFVYPRKIPIILPLGGVISNCQRPLRVQTPKGERVALANSEAVPAGSKVEIEIVLLDPKLSPLIIEWLEYGKLRGFGQWRNSGKGTFDYEIEGLG